MHKFHSHLAKFWQFNFCRKLMWQQ